MDDKDCIYAPTRKKIITKSIASPARIHSGQLNTEILLQRTFENKIKEKEKREEKVNYEIWKDRICGHQRESTQDAGNELETSLSGKYRYVTALLVWYKTGYDPHWWYFGRVRVRRYNEIKIKKKFYHHPKNNFATSEENEKIGFYDWTQ